MARDKYQVGERDSNLDLYSWWAMCLTRAGRIPGASLKSVEKPSEWECMIIGGAGPDIKPSPACPRTVILQIVDFYFEGRMTSYKTILQCQWKFNACIFFLNQKLLKSYFFKYIFWECRPHARLVQASKLPAQAWGPKANKAHNYSVYTVVWFRHLADRNVFSNYFLLFYISKLRLITEHKI